MLCSQMTGVFEARPQEQITRIVVFRDLVDGIYVIEFGEWPVGRSVIAGDSAFIRPTRSRQSSQIEQALSPVGR